MSNDNTKKQHYVPRAYLRFFSEKKKSDYYINVFDKRTNRNFKTNIENIASQTYFYEIKGKQKNYWEKYYNELETITPIIFKGIIAASKLLEDETKIINNYYKNELCKIIHSQLLMTNKSRIYFDEIGKNVVNKMLDTLIFYNKDILTNNHIKLLEKYRSNLDFIHESELDHFNTRELQIKTKEHMKNRTWILYKNINYKTHPFITSDNPVFYINHTNKKVGFGDNGIAKKETIIGFSISPELLLVLYPKYSWYLFIKDLADSLIYLDDINFVKKINEFQLKQCDNQIYSIKNI